MTQISRRAFIRLAGAGVWSAVATQRRTALVAPAGTSGVRQYQGADLSGWSVVVGDGVYSAPGEPPVSEEDIETMHYDTHSTLRANIQKRRVMAHNITYRPIIDSTALDFVHVFQSMFRLPYAPRTSNTCLNGQTLEGALFIWDGSATRLDYGMGFQWGLNPWDRLGELRCWTDAGGGQWEPVGHLEPDLEWHDFRMVLDCRRRTTELAIDGTTYTSRFAPTPKPADWGTEVAARAQVEIISLYPGEDGLGTLHKADFKDWSWSWEPIVASRAFLPMVVG